MENDTQSNNSSWGESERKHQANSRQKQHSNQQPPSNTMQHNVLHGSHMRRQDSVEYMKLRSENNGHTNDIVNLVSGDVVCQRNHFDEGLRMKANESSERGLKEEGKVTGREKVKKDDIEKMEEEIRSIDENDQNLSHVEIFDLPEDEGQILMSSEGQGSKVRELYLRQQATESEIQKLKEQLEHQNLRSVETDNNLQRTQQELEEAKAQVTLLDKKYNKAKKLIKEFQQREGEFLKRENNYKMQISTMEKVHELEILTLKNKINELEKSLESVNEVKRRNVNRNNSTRSTELPPRNQPSKFFPNIIDNDLASGSDPSVIVNDGTPKPTVRQSFDTLIASLDDMLDSRVEESSSPKWSGHENNHASQQNQQENTLDNTALKYRAMLKGPRYNKRSSQSDSDQIEGGGNIDIEHLHGSPLNKRSIEQVSPTARLPLQQQTNVSVTPSKDSPSLSVKLRRAVNGSSDKREAAQGNYIHLLSWTHEDVADWLKTVNLDNYVQLFLVHKIDGSKVLAIDNEKLKEMGISDKTEKNNMKRKIKDLKLRYEKEKKAMDKQLKKQKKGLKPGKKSLF